MQGIRNMDFKGVTLECHFEYDSYVVEGRRLLELNLTHVYHKGVDMQEFFQYYCESFYVQLEADLSREVFSNIP